MKKVELQAEIDRLDDKINRLQQSNQALVQGGLIYKRQFTEAYMLLQKLPGCSSHPLWLEIQEYLSKFESSVHPTYGRLVVPK